MIEFEGRARKIVIWLSSPSHRDVYVLLYVVCVFDLWLVVLMLLCFYFDGRCKNDDERWEENVEVISTLWWIKNKLRRRPRKTKRSRAMSMCVRTLELHSSSSCKSKCTFAVDSISLLMCTRSRLALVPCHSLGIQSKSNLSSSFNMPTASNRARVGNVNIQQIVLNRQLPRKWWMISELGFTFE